MEYLSALISALPELIAQGDLLAALLLIGAGTSIFLIADNGAQGFSIFNGAFVILGYSVGALITIAGVFQAYDILVPTLSAIPAAPEPSQ